MSIAYRVSRPAVVLVILLGFVLGVLTQGNLWAQVAAPARSHVRGSRPPRSSKPKEKVVEASSKKEAKEEKKEKKEEKEKEKEKSKRRTSPNR